MSVFLQRVNAYAHLLRRFRQAQADQNHQRLDALCLFAATEEEYEDLCARCATFDKNWGGRIGHVVLGGSEPIYMLFGPTEIPRENKALLRFQELAALAGEWLPPEILTALNVRDCKPINRWLTFLWKENPPDRSKWKISEFVFRPVWDDPCRVSADVIERTGLVNNKESATLPETIILTATDWGRRYGIKEDTARKKFRRFVEQNPTHAGIIPAPKGTQARAEYIFTQAVAEIVLGPLSASWSRPIQKA